MTGAGSGAAAAVGAAAGKNSVRAHSVEALAQHVEDIFAAHGKGKARFVLKYRHCDAKLSLRVTDDVKTAKYKTRRQAELGKVKRLVGAVVAGKESDGTTDMDVDHPASPQRAAGSKKRGGKKAKKG